MAGGGAARELLSPGSCGSGLPLGVQDTKPPEEARRADAPAPLSVLAATATLAQTILGSGVLALPYAIMNAGLLGGLAMLAFVGVLTALSMAVLVLLCSETGRFSYGELGAATLGDRGARAVALWCLVFTMGVVAAYPIALGDFLCSLICKFFPSATAWATPRVTMAIAVIAICWPLSCAKSLGFLKWSSAAGVVSVLLSSAVGVLRYFDGTYRGAEYRTNDVVAFNATGFGHCFPILVSALAANFAIPGLFREVAPEAGGPGFADSEEGRAAFRRMMQIIVGALAVSCVVYGAVGVAVYATFGPDTEDDLTKNFKKNDGLLVLVRATMAVAICATFPLVMMAARNAAYDLFLRPRGVRMTTAVRVSVTSAIVVVCLGTAEVVGSLGVVLDFNGALFGTPVSYIWPMAMYLALPRSKQRPRWRLFSFACVLLGLFFGLLGLVVASVGVATGRH